MAQKHVLKISAINAYFVDEQKLIERGENAMESDDVVGMNFDDQRKLIKGDVHASMRDRVYKVEISLGENKNIAEASCSCPRGKVKCHHIAALALFAHYNISVTDQSCWWSKKKSNNDETNTIDELYPAKKSFRASNRPATQEEVQELRHDLDKFGGVVGYTWLLSPKVGEQQKQLIKPVEDVVYSEDFQKCDSKITYFEDHMKIGLHEILTVAKETVGQSSNPLWLVARKLRLTASNFGAVLAACRREKFPPSLFKKLLGSYDIEGVKAIKWGRDNEKDAIEAFCAATNLKVEPTGVWLDSCGFLGASPDGLIGEDAIVEIKCPFKYRDSNLLEALTTDTKYICSKSQNGDFVINKDHNYFHQMQGQLYLTERKLCYLCIWTPKNLIILPVTKDEEWHENLQILKTFYLTHFLPHILNANK